MTPIEKKVCNMSNFINLMDLVYPVGSVYETFESTSPAEMFGGTWTQIETFLYGSTSAGSTGENQLIL